MKIQRLPAYCRVQLPRYPIMTVIGMGLSYLSVLGTGILIGVYWPCVARYVQSHDLGEVTLKFLPIAGALGGIVVFWWQVSRARYNQRIELIMKLAERFDRPEMRATRAKAARALRVDRNADDDAIGEALDFFEEVGFLFLHRAIDIDAVYEFFEYWITPYAQLSESYRKEEIDEKDLEDAYSSFSKLATALGDYEMARKGRMPARTESELADFLASESRLVTHPKPLARKSSNRPR